MAFYQNRLWYGNLPILPLTVFGSQENTPDNFDVGVENPADAIIETLSNSTLKKILFLNAGKELEIYTPVQDSVAPQEPDQGLQAANFTVRSQSAFGCYSGVKPRTYMNDSYFVLTGGKGLIRYHFTGVGESYQASNVSIATDLVNEPDTSAIVKLEDESQNMLLVLKNSDNTCTVFQTNEEIPLDAFTYWNFPDNVIILDILGFDNQLVALVQLSGTNTYLLMKYDTSSSYLDVQMDATMNASGVVTGLTIFEGYEVTVVYQGQDYGTKTVVSGQVTVDPHGNSGTVQVGFLYNWRVESMPIFLDEESVDIPKKVSKIYVEFYNSLGFTINGYSRGWYPYTQIQAGNPPTPFSGTIEIGSSLGYAVNQSIVLEQLAPFPITILGFSYIVSAEGV